MNLEVVFEDDYVVCVSKPNNVVVHHAYHSRNVSNEMSLLQLLYNDFGKLYPIHRLDRKTSGIILLAKETAYVSKFQSLFTSNEIIKNYFGIVRGHVTASQIINSPVKGRDSNVYKEAETYLQPLQQVTLNIPVKPYNTSRYSLIKLTPKTGRLHQLRIHMNKVSHPLIGDPKYGDKNHNTMFEREFNCKKIFLHAQSLLFKHPFTNEELELNAKFPEDWLKLFKQFNWVI